LARKPESVELAGTIQDAVLTLLSSWPGLGQREIARIIGCSPGTVNRIIQILLEQNRLVPGECDCGTSTLTVAPLADGA
jgi:hypothetical protein